MTSLISPKLCNTSLLTCNKPKFSQPLQIRAQIRRDHEGITINLPQIYYKWLVYQSSYIYILIIIKLFLGRSRNMVDANLHLLKVRMEEMRNKERLERCCVAEQGWNYAAVETFRTKSDNNNNDIIPQEFVELLGVVGATFGFTISGCTFCIYLISFLLHLYQ